MMPPKKEWNDEDDAKLKKLWDEKKTTIEIGKAFGVSHNAVIGRINRLRRRNPAAFPQRGNPVLKWRKQDAQ